MATNQMTLWKIIEQIEANAPLRPDKVESLLKCKLSLDDSSNNYFTFWQCGPLALRHGITATRIGLRVSNSDEHDLGVFTMELEGECLKRDEVQKHYGEIKIYGAPTGHSINEETTYITETASGKLVFGFAERDPDCLSSVGFSPKKR